MPDFKYKGLSTKQVTESRRIYGQNTLSPVKHKSVWLLYLEKYNDPIIRILLVAAMLSLVIGIFENQYVETIGIIIAIFLATSIGFYFEYDAGKKFDILNTLGEEDLVTVIRDDKVQQIHKCDIVKNDIVILEQGCEIPADGILLESISLQVNESSLTGEPMTRKTTNTQLFDPHATYPSNYVLRSSTILEGRGVMEVTAVGDNTEIGRVAQKAAEDIDTETPLNNQLNKLSSFVNRYSFIIAGIIFVVCTITGSLHLYHTTDNVEWYMIVKLLLDNFMIAVTLIVMAVPEGLPMAVTLSLALNMRRMLKTNNLVRKMHACETMGAITVICTDKTGTLTQNKMQVVEMLTTSEQSTFLYEGIAVNSTAHLEISNNIISNIGNPTECALLHYLHNNNQDYRNYRQQVEIIDQLPFSAEHKYMATLVKSTHSDKDVLYLKGAPEIVARFCNTDISPQTPLGTKLLSFQSSAMRTLAFAYLEIESGSQSQCKEIISQQSLHFLGIAAITDPVREEVPLAVQNCIDAGIKIKVVTGDTSATAIEVARRIGLWKEADTSDQITTGSEFEALSDDEAAQVALRIKVMSRARPLDKQRLVRLLQQQGEVVAVTGDGTNDAPALHHAHVGLSMGSGTAVAKEASDITLIDDSFRSIATAVMWGRSLYKNIQRFICYQMTISLTALIITAVGSLFGTIMPLTVTQILWINLILDTFASLALSTIPPTPDVMKQKPRNRADFIITHSMLTTIIITSLCFVIVLLAYLFYCNTDGIITIHELTIFFTSFVLLQIWNLLNAKHIETNTSVFSNLTSCKGLLSVILLIFVCQILIVQFGGNVFRTQPLTLTEWLVLTIITSLCLIKIKRLSPCLPISTQRGKRTSAKEEEKAH